MECDNQILESLGHLHEMLHGLKIPALTIPSKIEIHVHHHQHDGAVSQYEQALLDAILKRAGRLGRRLAALDAMTPPATMPSAK